MKKIIEEEAIDKNPPEGFLISDESDRKNPNIYTYDNLIGSTQEAEENRNIEDSEEIINNSELAESIIEEEEIKIFLEGVIII